MISLENMKLKSWLKFLTASSMIFCLVACGNKETPKGSQTTGQESSQTKLPEVSVSPTEMSKAYADNGIVADQQFKGKRVLITGDIAEINNDTNGNPYITMQSGSYQNRPVFKFDKGSIEELTKLKVGQKVSVICLGDGNEARVPMNKECKVIQGVANAQSSPSASQNEDTSSPRGTGSVSTLTDFGGLSLKFLGFDFVHLSPKVVAVNVKYRLTNNSNMTIESINSIDTKIMGCFVAHFCENSVEYKKSFIVNQQLSPALAPKQSRIITSRVRDDKKFSQFEGPMSVEVLGINYTFR